MIALLLDEGRRTKDESLSSRSSASDNVEDRAFVLGLWSSVGLCSALPRYNFLRIHKRHHPPQLGAHLLQLAFGIRRAHAVEGRPAVVVLFDPFLGKRAALDIRQQLLH